MSAVDDRLASLDAFRGLTIGAMVLVNNPGSWRNVYPPLRHAPWHGWTPTDLVFPFFLFVVGVSMTFALPRQLDRLGRVPLYRRILRRALVLFALGLLLNLSPGFHFAELRVAGVLQRIAVVYLAASILFLETSRRAQLLTTGGLLVGYWAAMSWIAAPGHIVGTLAPEGNLASWLDQVLLPGRLWRETWDPEGLFSTLPAIATAMLGVFTGYWIRSGRERAEVAAGMFTAGWGLILGGLAWDLIFPINKNLWTSSYVLFTAGAALQGLACCYWLIDVRGHRRWAAPAIVFGLNPIALYVLSSLMARVLYLVQLPGQPEGTTANVWLYENLFAPWASPVNASLAYAIAYLALWWLLMAVLQRRGIVIKV